MPVSAFDENAAQEGDVFGCSSDWEDAVRRLDTSGAGHIGLVLVCLPSRVHGLVLFPISAF